MWAWLIFNMGLLLLLLRIDSAQQLFTPLRFILSIVLIFTATWWLEPAQLAWYNTALSYTYSYQATGVSGKKYKLSPHFFSPYGDIMTMANFRYISPEPRLVGPYGITQNPQTVQKLQTLKTASDVFMLEKSNGRVVYNAIKAAQFYAFLSDYLTHYNAYLRTAKPSFFIECCSTLAQFWSLEPEQAYTGQEPIKNLSVLEVTTFYDNVELKVIRQQLLNSLSLP